MDNIELYKNDTCYLALVMACADMIKDTSCLENFDCPAKETCDCFTNDEYYNCNDCRINLIKYYLEKAKEIYHD